MKKSKILAILLVMVMAFTFAAACADDEPEDVTLRFAVWDIEMVAYYAPLIEAYKEIAPHVTIEMVDLGASDYENILQTQLMGGASGYDLIKVRGIPQYVNNTNADLLLALDSFLPDSDIDLANYRGMPEQHMRGGPLYALPFRSDFWVIYYNKDIFDAANVAYPNNQMVFEDWVQIIKDVTSGDGADKVFGNHFHTWRSTTTLFGILDGVTDIGMPPYGWMQRYYDAVIELEDGGFVPRRSDNQAGSIHHRMKWAPQEVAQVNMGTWFMAENNDNLWEFNWGMAAYPVPSAAHYGSTFGNVTQLSIPRTSENAQEAFNFIAFVCGEEGAKILASVGQFPAFMTDEALNIITSNSWFPTDAQSRAALQPSRVFLELPIVEEAGEIDGILNEAHQEIMDRTMSVADAIAMMETRVNQLLGR